MSKTKSNMKKIIIYGLFGLLIGLVLGIIIATNFNFVGNATKPTLSQADKTYTSITGSECPCSGPNTEYCDGKVICCCGGMPGCCSRNGEKPVQK